MDEPGPLTQNPGAFRTTHWSLVFQAGAAEDGSRALESLCRNYWYPLYAYVRRRGYRPEEAQDLTQEFFARLLEGNWLEKAHPDRGRFRGFLVTSLKSFLANEWRDANRLKRGGGCLFLSWEELDAEERFSVDVETEGSPEEVYDREWAETVAANVRKRLGEEMKREGNLERFEALRTYLEADGPAAAYSDAAIQLGLSVSAVKSAIYRLRKRYANLIRDEIAQTVSSSEEVEDEIRRLISVLGS